MQGSDNAGAIIFIDELDAVGTKRFDSELSGDREVQRTMLELLNQLDGFSSEDRIKVRTCPSLFLSNLQSAHVPVCAKQPFCRNARANT